MLLLNLQKLGNAMGAEAYLRYACRRWGVRGVWIVC